MSDRISINARVIVLWIPAWIYTRQAKAWNHYNDHEYTSCLAIYEHLLHLFGGLAHMLQHIDMKHSAPILHTLFEVVPHKLYGTAQPSGYRLIMIVDQERLSILYDHDEEQRGYMQKAMDVNLIVAEFVKKKHWLQSIANQRDGSSLEAANSSLNEDEVAHNNEDVVDDAAAAGGGHANARKRKKKTPGGKALFSTVRKRKKDDSGGLEDKYDWENYCMLLSNYMGIPYADVKRDMSNNYFQEPVHPMSLTSVLSWHRALRKAECQDAHPDACNFGLYVHVDIETQNSKLLFNTNMYYLTCPSELHPVQ